jgi:hypothetical protein
VLQRQLSDTHRNKTTPTLSMDSQDILLLTGFIALLGSFLGLARSARLSNSLFSAGCIFYGFWILYFCVPMLDMATRRGMESVSYAASNEALEASCYAVVLSLLVFTFVYFALRAQGLPQRENLLSAGSPEYLPRWFVRCAFILLAVGSIGKWQVISSFGGVSVDLLLNLSASVRHANAAQAPAVWVFAASLFDAGLYMLIFYLIVARGHYMAAVALVTLGVVLTLVIGGKRIVALGFVVAAAVWYIKSERSSLRSQLTLVFAALLVSTVALLARIVIPTWLLGSVEHTAVALDTMTRPIQTVLDSGELGLFEGTNFAFECRDEFLSDYTSGLHLLLSQTIASALFLVPRAVWAGKPEPFDFSQMFYSLLVGDDRGSGWGIGPVGVGFIWGAWLGVILTALMAGTLARFIDSRLSLTHLSAALLFALPFILVSYFHLLRFGSPGFVLVNAYMNLLPLVCVSVLLHFSRRQYE